MLTVMYRLWPVGLMVTLLALALAAVTVYAQLGDTQTASGVINAVSITGSLPGDANGDDVVNVADLRLVMENWGIPVDIRADLNEDDFVDIQDLAIVGRYFGQSL